MGRWVVWALTHPRLQRQMEQASGTIISYITYCIHTFRQTGISPSPLQRVKKKRDNSISLQDRIVVLQNPPGDFPSWGNIHFVSSLAEPSAVPAPSQLTLCKRELSFPRSQGGNVHGPRPPRLLARRPLSLVQKVSLPLSSPLSPPPQDLQPRET